jgi:glycogen operon protein
MEHDILPGQCYPLGATVRQHGVNFAVFSKNCTAVELLFFDDVDAARPARVIHLDPLRNRTFYYWHVYVPGISSGQLYAYRVFGPFEPEQGLRFDGAKVLLDPYAPAVAIGRRYEREAAVRRGDNAAHCLKSVVFDPRNYNWEGDSSLHRPLAGTVIYEMHVGGFTRHPNAGVSPHLRGTYAGLIEKIPYLVDLGITALELLPVQQFDAQDFGPSRTDYWGYNPVAFFAPHRGYCGTSGALCPLDEFRDMVKALHRAGVEVILDMVFNHTSEGDHTGPTLSFRGLENRAYYILEADRSQYANFTGCGNTFNGNQSIARRLIVDCLRYWVQVMHVDGFRFDLASVFSRDEWGTPLRSPPILWEIESDPVLAGCKIIAEAWDAVGLYQVGSFVGHRWAEWNGRFRDDVRCFVKGDAGMVRPLGARLLGSPDLYAQPDRDPHRSVNFVTCHDGFTLHDLVAYDSKHNEANGEANRDGMNENHSWNCGVEGATDDPGILALRQRQMKNLMTILLLAHGTPMLLMGDEVARTQNGNNNAYCQDNETTWFDWSDVERHADLLRFVRKLIHFRRRHPEFRAEHFWKESDEGQGSPIITWHGVRLHEPDLGGDSHSLAFSLQSADGHEMLHVILNSYWAPLQFELPELPQDIHWQRIADTALASPHDIVALDNVVPVDSSDYDVAARSIVILKACQKKPADIP